MFDKPMIINDHAKCEATYLESIEFLEANPELRKRLATYLWAYHEIGNLIPQTLDNLFSGHYFPCSESYYELESSYELTLQGFYTYALVALRSVLELGLLGVYFAVDDREHVDVRPWITSQERTPRRKEIFDQLRRLPAFQTFDDQFGRIVSSIVRQLKLEFSVEIKRPLRLFQGQPLTCVSCGIRHVRGFIDGLWSIDPDCSWQLGRGG
jgi:hypothetical protein